jgi:hypothetical protein
MKIAKIALIMSLPLFLVACNTTREPVTVSRIIENMEIIQPDQPRPITTRSVNLTVYDREALADALQDDGFRRIIGMSERDYANIAHNIQESIRFIQSQAATIEYYETVLRELRERNVIE